MTRKATLRPLPALPKEVQLPAGPYRVIRAEIPPESDQKEHATNWGKCDFEARVITVKPGIARVVAHLTLEHEKGHAVFFDAGVEMDEELEERICNTLAAYRVFEMQQSLGSTVSLSGSNDQ